MDINKAAESLARWLCKIQAEGRPCPTNVTQSAVMVLKCSREMANRARRVLVDAGRLTINPTRHLFIIDGNHFDKHVIDMDEVSIVKTLLRKRCRVPVYDPRTVAKPNAVADGEPQELMIGNERIPYPEARAMVLA